MTGFEEKYTAFLKEFAKGKTMVLSTAENGKVSSRMMSVVCIGGEFYFQTDRTFRKYQQLLANPHVALCIDNIQIEGICRELGHPMDDPDFCAVFKECFGGSFRAYSLLKNERLFAVSPRYIERWVYSEGLPFIEKYDVEKREYSLRRYQGI